MANCIYKEFACARRKEMIFDAGIPVCFSEKCLQVIVFV